MTVAATLYWTERRTGDDGSHAWLRREQRFVMTEEQLAGADPQWMCRELASTYCELAVDVQLVVEGREGQGRSGS